MSRVWAAFDFPASPPDRDARLRGVFRRPPVRVLRAWDAQQVRQVLAEAEALASRGAWVLGGVAWSGAFAPDQQVIRDPETPWALFEVHQTPPEPWVQETPPPLALDWRAVEPVAAVSAKIEQVLEQIRAGDCYQVNLTSQWWADKPTDPEALYHLFQALAAAQPGGYLFYSATAQVASASPELFFDFRESRIVTQPMKGTAPAAADPASLLHSQKERAENLMIVDLLRNDLGRVCEPGTVRVDRLFELHALPTVWQLTSTISGRAQDQVGLVEVFEALFPCGSVTGAPKLAAMQVITELESSPRGWYCGALGVLRPGGTATFNVPIRTVVGAADRFVCGIGSGIVADSRPDNELAEWHTKTAFLAGHPLRALETMLVEDQMIHRREPHLARLQRTCAELELPLDLREVTTALNELVTNCGPGRFRLRLLAGNGAPQVELGPAPVTAHPVRLALADAPLDTTGWLAPVIRNKTTHRQHYQRLRAAAPDGVFDVICHNLAGELTECTTGNLALKLDATWYTPAETSGLLPGVYRAELLSQGRLVEARLTLEDLRRAQGLAFLNSLRGWCPASLLN